MGMKILKQQKFPELPPLDLIGPQVPESIQDLDKKEFAFRLETGHRFSLTLEQGMGMFETSHPEFPQNGHSRATICTPRDGIYMISLDLVEPVTNTITCILMMTQGRAILVHQKYIGDDTAQFDRGPNVVQDFYLAAIEGVPCSGEIPMETRDLLGGRDFLVFDKNDIREFIYLNKTRLLEHYVYTKVLNGKAERHHATYMRLSDQLYLIGWREMDTNIAYVGIFDYQSRKMMGTCFFMVSPWEATAKLTGALMVPVNGRIDYLDGLEPTN